MKVKMLINTSWGANESSRKLVKPNDVIEIEDSLAKEWIKAGYCVKAQDAKKKPAKKPKSEPEQIKKPRKSKKSKAGD